MKHMLFRDYLIIVLILNVIGCHKTDSSILINCHFSGSFSPNQEIHINLIQNASNDTTKYQYRYKEDDNIKSISIEKGAWQLQIATDSAYSEIILSINANIEIDVKKNNFGNISIQKYREILDRIMITDQNYNIYVNSNESESFIEIAKGGNAFWVDKTTIGFMDFSGKTISYLNLDKLTIFNTVDLDASVKGKIFFPYFIKSLNKIAFSPNEIDKNDIILLKLNGRLDQKINLDFNYAMHLYDPSSELFIVLTTEPSQLLSVNHDGKIKDTIFTAEAGFLSTNLAMSPDSKIFSLNYVNKAFLENQILLIVNDQSNGYPIKERIKLDHRMSQMLQFSTNMHYLYFYSDNNELVRLDLGKRRVESIGLKGSIAILHFE